MYSYRAVRFIFVCSFLFGWGLLGSAPTTQTSFPQPSFAAPPLFAVHGPNVGIGGFFSMAQGDFNNDGISDFATVGFACANGVGDYLELPMLKLLQLL
jgi:hypothetical protein